MNENNRLDYGGSLELFEKLISTISGLERKGKTMPYTSLNGHMFSFLAKDGTMGLRLPKESREEFLEEHNSMLMVQHGSVMKEYVMVPDYLLQDTDRLKAYYLESYQYIKSLKPKPTKK